MQEAEGELEDVVEHSKAFGKELKHARESLDALPDVGHSQVGKAAARQIESLKHNPQKK
jgi:DNA anti-recombination protein RmuC